MHGMTFLVVLALATLAQAQTFTVLAYFSGSNGLYPDAGVIRDPNGNLYGTTTRGGDLNCGTGYGCGVVYKLGTDGTETVLHSFSGGADGSTPAGAVIRDKAGNLYGTTFEAGSSNCAYGCGTVFRINTAGNETVLYSFTGGSDGCNPYQGLVMGKGGNLYGTTHFCGSSNYGTIFKVNSAGKFTLLHGFAGSPSDGATPEFGHPIIDQSGSLYGVTDSGGASDYGVLYKLSKGGKLTILHSFAGGTTDGCNPYGSVLRDKAGNIYGTTSGCGNDHSYGVIWRVSKNGKEAILHNFAGGQSDGCFPLGGVARDPMGNLYGLTTDCGSQGYGVVYELSTNGTPTVLHSFDELDGAYPLDGVLRTTKGTLFGTAGGFVNCYYAYGVCGTAWKYVP